VHRHITIIFLSVLLGASSWAQGNNILSTVSPKLKIFMSHHSEAAKILTDAFSSSFSNKTVRLNYFYSNDESDSEARAFHYYPNTVGQPEVVLCVRENQSPLDEFISVLFETLNSKSEAGFTKLSQDAYYGTISREQFAKEVRRYEFEAIKSTRAALVTLKFGKKETNGSYYYTRLIECPTEFADFLPYSKRISPNRDFDKEYELQYDSLRKVYSEYHDSNSPSNSPAKN
jgi:hypothetical protein